MTSNQVQRLRQLTKTPASVGGREENWGNMTAEKLLQDLDWDGYALSRSQKQKLSAEDEYGKDNLRREIESLMTEHRSVRNQAPPLSRQQTTAFNPRMSDGSPAQPTRPPTHANGPFTPLVPIPPPSSAPPANPQRAGAAYPSGSQTARGGWPRTNHVASPSWGGDAAGPAERITLLERHYMASRGSQRNKGDAAASEEVAKLREQKRELEKTLRKQAEELAAEKAVTKQLREAVVDLEYCLATKETEIDDKDYDMGHLRYLLGVKEADAEQYKVQMQFAKGGKPDLMALAGVEHGEEAVEVRGKKYALNGHQQIGKGRMVELEGAAYTMEAFLKEEERRMAELEMMEAHAGELISEVEEEAKRRSQYGAAAEDYHGHNGEYMRSGCPVCHRLVMVMDQAIGCELITASGGQVGEADGGDAVESKKKAMAKKKGKRRLPGVPPPFDVMVVDADRWVKEKETRSKMLTDKKLLVQVTSIMCEKIVADATDDAAGHPRESMHIFLHEYFLSVYGIRSLCDFYLLELLEGCRLFASTVPRVRHFTQMCLLGFVGDNMDDKACKFYLELYSELAVPLGKDRKLRKLVNEAPKAPGGAKSGTAKLASLIDSNDSGQAVFNIDLLTKRDVPITFKTMVGWRAMRKVMSKHDVKWLPEEYPSIEQVVQDADGWGTVITELDAFMDFALAEFRKVESERRQYLIELFYEADEDGSGMLDFTEFKAIVEKVDPTKTPHECSHLFRMIMDKEDGEVMGLDAFCDIMQQAGLDRAFNQKHNVDDGDFASSMALAGMTLEEMLNQETGDGSALFDRAESDDVGEGEGEEGGGEVAVKEKKKGGKKKGGKKKGGE